MRHGELHGREVAAELTGLTDGAEAEGRRLWCTYADHLHDKRSVSQEGDEESLLSLPVPAFTVTDAELLIPRT